MEENFSEYELFLQNLRESERKEFEQKLRKMIEDEDKTGIHYSPSPGGRLMRSWGKKLKIGKINI